MSTKHVDKMSSTKYAVDEVSIDKMSVDKVLSTKYLSTNDMQFAENYYNIVSLLFIHL